MTRPLRRFLAALLVLAAPEAMLAQPKPAKPLFADDAPLRFRIQGPIAAAGSSNAPLDAVLTVAGTAPETLAIRLSGRGITRREHDICAFPPLKITFAGAPAAGSPFAGQKSLKLVTHCRPDAGFQRFLLLEYAAYRIYALLTPASFATRLASIDYIDAKGRPIASRLGFLIEDVDDLARRNGAKEYKTTSRVAPSLLNARDAGRYAMFQAMIGNLDWAMVAGPAGSTCCHNSKLIGTAGGAGGLVPVPYDFDFAGMVDAPYATPPQGIRVPNVRVRRYRGYCRHDAPARAAAAEIAERRGAIMGVLDALPQLDERPRRKAQAYLAEFFDGIATPAGLGKLMATCLG